MFLPQTGRSRSAQFLVGTPFRQGPGLGTRGACPPAWPHAVSLTVGTARTPQASRPGLDSQPQLPVEQGAGYWLRSGVGPALGPITRLLLSGLHLRKRRIKGRPVVTCV